MFIFRFIFYFTLSFAILCIPIGNGRHFFDKCFDLVTPYTQKVVKTTKQKFSTVKRYSKMLYSNSEPVEKDEIKTKLSATKKEVQIEQKPALDAYTDEERERLQKVLNDY